MRYLAEHHEICLFALTDEDVTRRGRRGGAARCAGAGSLVHRLRRPALPRSMARALATGRPAASGLLLRPRCPTASRIGWWPSFDPTTCTASRCAWPNTCAPRRPLPMTLGLHGRVFGGHGAPGHPGPGLAAAAVCAGSPTPAGLRSRGVRLVSAPHHHRRPGPAAVAHPTAATHPRGAQRHRHRLFPAPARCR
ncbi:MAG: hypothetical protein WKG07_06625 [Hymenobacter sp.]